MPALATFIFQIQEGSRSSSAFVARNEDLNESSGRLPVRAIRLVSKAARGRKIKTFCGG